MNRGNLFALVLFAGCTAAALLLVPASPLQHLTDPAYRAVLGGAVVLPVLLLLRLLGRRGVRAEKALFALFLASMPLIYMESCLEHGGGRWIWIEAAGFVVFAGLAVLGLWRSPWFLVVGIAAHGLLWDAWHHGRTAYIDSFYPVLCLIVDVGFAAYAAAQVTRWKEASVAHTARLKTL